MNLPLAYRLRKNSGILESLNKDKTDLEKVQKKLAKMIQEIQIFHKMTDLFFFLKGIFQA